MSDLIIHNQGPILEIIIDRPKANAIDSKTSLELNRLFSEFNKNDQHRVAIISGSGDKYFCTGGDLKELDAKEANVNYGKNGFAGLTHFTDLNKPVIAAVNGLCVGGGFELVLACDLVIASEHANFFLSETLIGNVPYLVSIQRLLHRLPKNIAMEMLYTGRQMSAKELRDLGVINHIVPHNQLRDQAYALAESIVNSAPLAISACKKASSMIETESIAETITLNQQPQMAFFDAVMTSEDAKEGARAFVEKRKPKWLGR